jgi:signal transduction histidine kinase
MAVRDGEAELRRMRRDLPTLEAVERRRGQLWAIATVLLLATSAAVLLLIAQPDAAAVVPDSVGIRFGFLGVSGAFVLYVFDQERRLRRLSEALVRERILSAALSSRVRDLGTLSRVGQIVNTVLTMHEVLEIILDGAFELTRAATGSVMLVDGEELVVAVSGGRDAAPVGARQSLAAGVAGWVATRREPLLVTGELQEGQLPALQLRSRGQASSVCAPMLVADELVGIVALERDADDEPFTDWEMRAVTLFAAHAATAVSNARRYEVERENVERLAQLVERRSEFVATMVHDLKSPLTAILGVMKLLRHRSATIDEVKRDELMTRIESSSEQLLTMVEDVLEGASADAASEVRREPVDVLALVRELATNVRSMGHARDGAERHVVVEVPDGPVLLHADRAALRSMLVNLLENALKYSAPRTPIRVVVGATGGEVRLSVSDQGAGIPAEELDGIFERFRQREGVARGGVGLGLYIVRSLVEAQGGRVSVRSQVGRGSTFTIVLPRRTPPAASGLEGWPRDADGNPLVPIVNGQPIMPASLPATSSDSRTSTS